VTVTDRREIIRRAFDVFGADVATPPPLTLRGGERVDSYDVPKPYDADHDTLTDEYIEAFAFHALPFLDARSWRHYLPRLMEHAFRRPDEPTGLVLQALIRSLRAPDREPPRLTTLTAEQETVVVAFLEAIAGDPGREEDAEAARQALLEWWVPNARHRPTEAEIAARREAPVSWHEVGQGTYRLSVPATFSSTGVREVPSESRRVEIWTGYLRGDVASRVLVHFEALRGRTLGAMASQAVSRFVRADGEPTYAQLEHAKRACRLSGLSYGYSYSVEELERVLLLLAIVGEELLTVRAAAWDYGRVDADLERIVTSFRLT
jgi:uncharacterized protein DUF6714